MNPLNTLILMLTIKRNTKENNKTSYIDSYLNYNPEEEYKHFLDAIRVFSLLIITIIIVPIIYSISLKYFNIKIHTIYHCAIFTIISIIIGSFFKFYIEKNNEYVKLCNVIRLITTLIFSIIIYFCLLSIQLDKIGSIIITLFFTIYHLILMIDCQIIYKIRNRKSLIFCSSIISIVSLLMLCTTLFPLGMYITLTNFSMINFFKF